MVKDEHIRIARDKTDIFFMAFHTPGQPFPCSRLATGARKELSLLLFCFHLNHTLIPGPIVKGHKGDFLMRFQAAYQLDKIV